MTARNASGGPKEALEVGKELTLGDEMNADVAKPPAGGQMVRAQAALTLKMSGANYANIADTLGYADPKTARREVERLLASAGGEEDVGKQRVLNTRRLERVLQSLWSRATNPKDTEHLAYARTALLYIDRIVKLQGLDAPSQVVVHTPERAEITAWIEQMVSAVAGANDVLEAEVVDDDDGDS